MVEYAILFIVLSILFIGGAELGMAALASYKNTDAAKTGINEYAEVNQRRLNILNAEKQYLISLASSGCAAPSLLDSDADNIYETIDCSSSPPAGSISAANFIKLLDRVQRLYVTIGPGDGLDDGFGDLAEFANSDIILKLSGGQVSINLNTNSESSDGDPCDSVDTCTDSSSDDANLDVSDIQSIIEKESVISNQYNSPKKFIKLILLQHLKLALLPLDVPIDTDGNETIDLSEAKIAIGNHASSNIQQPSCKPGNAYDYGFPVDGVNDRYIAETGEGYKVYLFNPLPIDVASCEGVDDSRGNRSRLSILVGGYSDPNDPTKNEPGLPKLNQAMYGMYKSDLNGNLIPPGKMCVSDDTNICPDQDLISDDIGPTGYFRWNKGSDSNEAFRYTISNVDADLQNFRPSMQIECNTSPIPKSNEISSSSCNSTYSKVRLHTRYRKIFEGFLGFGVRAIDVSNDEDYEAAVSLFYNPNNGSLNGQVNGVIDSEIGPLGNNGRLSVKQFKDFRGCYEVDVETNQISACN